MKKLKTARSLSLEKVARAGDTAVEQPPLINARLAHRHHLRSHQAFAADMLLCNDWAVFNAGTDGNSDGRGEKHRGAGGHQIANCVDSSKRFHRRKETASPRSLLLNQQNSRGFATKPS